MSLNSNAACPRQTGRLQSRPNAYKAQFRPRHTRCRQVPQLAAAMQFEPQVDSQALAAQLVVLTATTATAAYWWFSVVPSARRTLAKEKRSGPLNEYLIDLQSNPNRGVERWFYTDWLQQLQRRQNMANTAAAKRVAAAAGLTAVPDEQQQQVTVSGATSPLPGVKDGNVAAPLDAEGSIEEAGNEQPSFWSLDNPILATAAILALLVGVSAVWHSS